MKIDRKLIDMVVLIKGGGEMGTAVAHRLARCHFRVCITEIPFPMAVNREVAFSEAVYNGEKEVEGVIAKLVGSTEEIFTAWARKEIPVMVDPETSIKDVLHPDVLIDAIMAKRNLGAKITDANLVMGLGPGFEAGGDVHAVVETNYYSNNLGKVLLQGRADEDTGIPLDIGGFTFHRVLRAPREGVVSCYKKIGDPVSPGEVIALVEDQPVKAELGGILRGLLRSGTKVNKETKLGEIDPSGIEGVCYQIRPRMRAIAGGVLEAILMFFNL